MQIKCMEDVKKNLGKKVRFQFETMSKPVNGTIIFGDFKDCKGESHGWDNEYFIVFDEIDDSNYTWCVVTEHRFKENNFLVFKTIEENFTSNNTEKEYKVSFYKDYDAETRKGYVSTWIKATLVNDYPNNMVFVNENGMYKMPINAIIMMYPINKRRG